MSLEVQVVSLGELLAKGVSKSSIRRAFSRFSCERDCDASRFLKAHAIQNEISGASRTYLVLLSDTLNNEGVLKVVAFVTLAVTATDYTSIDTVRRFEIMGRVPSLETATHFPGYLIAQLARDDRYSHEDLNAAKLLPLAEGLMRAAIRLVGGRMAYIDCKDGLLGYYAEQGYEPVYFDGDKVLYKLAKALC